MKPSIPPHITSIGGISEYFLSQGIRPMFCGELEKTVGKECPEFQKQERTDAAKPNYQNTKQRYPTKG